MSEIVKVLNDRFATSFTDQNTAFPILAEAIFDTVRKRDRVAV